MIDWELARKGSKSLSINQYGNDDAVPLGTFSRLYPSVCSKYHVTWASLKGSRVRSPNGLPMSVKVKSSFSSIELYCITVMSHVRT